MFIASEEQFKTYQLPMLKSAGKYKLTAHEGARTRRVGLAAFTSKENAAYSENCFVCLTNLGDLIIHSLPELRRQALTNCMKKEDVIAISTLVFTPRGEAFYMCSPSELQRVSVSARHVTKPSGVVDVNADARKNTDKAAETNKEEEAQGKTLRHSLLSASNARLFS